MGPGPLLRTKAAKSPLISGNSRIVTDTEYTFSLQLGTNAPDNSVDIELRAYFATVLKKSSGELELKARPSTTIGGFLDQRSDYFDGIEIVPVGKSAPKEKDFVVLGQAMADAGISDTLLVVLGRGIGAAEGTLYECGIVYNVEGPATVGGKKSRGAKRVK